MSVLDIRPCLESDTRKKYVAEGPIDFETWLQASAELDTELVGGVMIDRMAAQYPHEWIFVWLISILRPFVTHRKLGVVLGSRSAVKITGNDGRLPDILFVREENKDVIHKEAIYGVPDVVIEIVSQYDGPSDLMPLESDYRAIGVPEIVFIDPQKKRVRLVTKTAAGYGETYVTEGRLQFASIPGFWIEIEWLFAGEKPDEFDVTRALIEAAELETSDESA